MKKQNNTTKTCSKTVGASIARPFFEEIAKNNKKSHTQGITLIALVITIIILLILAGVVLNLTLGEHGILKKAEQSAEQYKISEILEKLELEKVDLVARKNGAIPSLQEYIDHLINKGIITIADVTDIDDNNKNIVVEGYVFLVEKEASGNIKITYGGKDTKEPRIAKLQATSTIDSITIKVIASNADGASYKYSIKNITLGEPDFSEIITISDSECMISGLTTNNEYIIQVELITPEGTDTKETGTIKTEPPKVVSITLDKTNIELIVGGTDVITAEVLPENALDKTITWASSNTDVVTVDDSGNIEAIGEGVAIITVTSNEVSTVTANCNITVTLPPPPTAGAGGETHTAKQIQYTWEELNSLAKVISDNYGTEVGQVNNNTAEVNVSINGKSGTLGIGDWTTVNGKQVRILGFNHDALTDASAYGEGETNTYAGISFEYVNLLTKAKVNSTNVNDGGWGACEIRNTLNNTIYNGLENKKYIKQVNKKYIATYNDANSVTIANDYLWLLSCSEIWNKPQTGVINGTIFGGAVTKEGERYKFYNVLNPNPDVNNAKMPKDKSKWYLRSPALYYSYGNRWCYVHEEGSCGVNAANYEWGIASGFCI